MAPSSPPTFFKDLAALQSAPLAPAPPLSVRDDWPRGRRAFAATFNRLGGLMRAVARETGVEPPAVVAVWQVESGGAVHTPGRAILRFEAHLFYRAWGVSNENAYLERFRHGGLDGQPGQPWQNQQFRPDPEAPFQPIHGDQDSEYRALAIAAELAGDDKAYPCASIGGPQLLMDNWRMIGYEHCRAMHDAFQEGERAHVLGFFDFCRSKRAPRSGALLDYLRERRWRDFAHYYNGPGQADRYGALIRERYEEGKAIGIA